MTLRVYRPAVVGFSTPAEAAMKMVIVEPAAKLPLPPVTLNVMSIFNEPGLVATRTGATVTRGSFSPSDTAPKGIVAGITVLGGKSKLTVNPVG